MHVLRRCSLSGVIAASTLTFGCGDKAAPPPEGTIVFQLSARHPAAADSGVAFVAADSVVAQGRDTIFLRRVRLVLAELAISPSQANGCEEEEGEEDKPHCVEFEMQPVALELPLKRAVVRRATRPAPVTEYNLFQVVVHRPDAAVDTAFLAAHPDLAGMTIRADGVFSHGGKRRDFTYVTDWSELQEIVIDPPVAVAVGESLHVTLRVDVASWFRQADGKALVDPATAGRGGPHEALVRDNIRTSLKVFRDGNGDGLEDAAPPVR
jgi:hypothetical protein